MSIKELDNLVGTDNLTAEPPSREEFEGMVASARTQLIDAQNKNLDPDSRFTLAYGAAHRFALAALRHAGYRPVKSGGGRTTVFQTLVYTVDLDYACRRILSKAHDERNLAEYQGSIEIDPHLLAELISCTKKLEVAVGKLAPLPPSKK